MDNKEYIYVLDYSDCAIYEIMQEEKKTDRKGNVIGKVILSRCTNCGKIKQTVIYTEEGYGRE